MTRKCDLYLAANDISVEMKRERYVNHLLFNTLLLLNVRNNKENKDKDILSC